MPEREPQTNKETKLAIPQEVQEAFARIYGRGGDLIKIYPKKLLTVKEDWETLGVRRSYFFWAQESEKIEFFVSAGLHFIGNKCDRFEITLFGEYGKGIFGDHTSADIDSYNTGCDFKLDNRVFKLHFNQGLLCQTYFFPEQDAVGPPEVRVPVVVADKRRITFAKEVYSPLSRLLKKSSLRLQGDESEYQYEVEKKKIKLQAFKKGHITDVLEFPQEIDHQQIINELFDPATLEDPINAPPELDDSWRFADLMETIGVRWGRF